MCYLYRTSIRAADKALCQGRVASWRVPIAMDMDFCVEALKEAMEKHGKPEISNPERGGD